MNLQIIFHTILYILVACGCPSSCPRFTSLLYSLCFSTIKFFSFSDTPRSINSKNVVNLNPSRQIIYMALYFVYMYFPKHTWNTHSSTSWRMPDKYLKCLYLIIWVKCLPIIPWGQLPTTICTLYERTKLIVNKFIMKTFIDDWLLQFLCNCFQYVIGKNPKYFTCYSPLSQNIIVSDTNFWAS